MREKQNEVFFAFFISKAHKYKMENPELGFWQKMKNFTFITLRDTRDMSVILSNPNKIYIYIESARWDLQNDVKS